MNEAKLVEQPAITPVILWEKSLHEKPCRQILEFGDELQSLYKKLLASMHYYQGLGIAAPQIGEFQCLAIINFQGRHLVMVNPRIVSSKGFSTEYEACLSLPGVSSKRRDLNNRAKVTRAKELDLQWCDLNREKHEESFTGYLAHAIQHEIDHLSGLFFIDRCGDLARGIVLRNFERFKAALEDE